jgi:HTH-type transcriptional repressor of NAD biosynthesis genes
MIGKKIDIVFCGNDYNEDSFYAKCYKESKIHYFDRNEISSTKIRSNPYKYWGWIPNVVRPHFIKKVLLIGGESVGKSTLTINLANYYNTNYIEEVGRELSEKSGTHELMLPEDFTEILLRHKINEVEMIQTSNKILFVDTDCLITKFYIQFLEGNQDEKTKNEQLADVIAELNNFDLVLFLEPDVEFVQDGTRTEEIEKNRIKYSNQIKSIFNEKNIKYHSITGNYEERFLKAIEFIDERIGLNSTNIAESVIDNNCN